MFDVSSRSNSGRILDLCNITCATSEASWCTFRDPAAVLGQLRIKRNTLAVFPSIAIRRDRRWPQMAKEEGDKIHIFFSMTYGTKVVSALMLDVSLLGVGTVLHLGWDAGSIVKLLR